MVAEKKPAEKKPTVAKKMNRTQRSAAFFREVYAELKKVHWPNRQQLLTYTGVVFVSVGILAVLFWIFDSGISFIINQLLG